MFLGRTVLDPLGIAKHQSNGIKRNTVLCEIRNGLLVVPFDLGEFQNANSIVLVSSSFCHSYPSAVQTRSSMRSQLPCMIFSMSVSV